MTNRDELPLAGIKVLDFTWVMAGPATTRYLADYGATVIKIETSTRIETGRTMAPYWQSVTDPERSAFMADNNAGKLGLALNCGLEEGRAIAMRLVEWADVVAEAFTPRVMSAWGMDYASLSAVNPGIIMLSTSLSGTTGPFSQFAGFGTLGAALSGFIPSAQWPGRAPAGPFGAYTDYVAPKFGVAALMAALDHRRRTGVGQLIDLSQAEAAIHFLGAQALDYTVNDHVAAPAGNGDPVACPHGVYPCLGAGGPSADAEGRASQNSNDRWVAIAIETESQWAALCGVIGPAIADDPRFNTVLERRRNEVALDAAIGAWTAQWEPSEAERTLHAAGVPAAEVQTIDTIFSEAQLNHRGHFVKAPHAMLGEAWVENSRVIMRGTPAIVSHAGPAIGQHNEEVLRGILGMSDEEIVAAVTSGAIE